MGLVTIRKLTSQDEKALELVAAKFCKRHGIDTSTWDTATEAIDYTIGYDSRFAYDAPRLARLWSRVMARTLRVRHSSRLTTGYGYVGLRCE